jgi:hypothetical protein
LSCFRVDFLLKFSVMKPLVIAALVYVMTGPAGNAAVPVKAGVTVSAPSPIEASISGPGDAQSDGALRTFAMACGILAFAAAAQQAFFRGRLAGVRLKPGQE